MFWRNRDDFDNKRLGCALEFVKLVQNKRNNTCFQSASVDKGLSRKYKEPTEKNTTLRYQLNNTLALRKYLEQIKSE